jgi:glycosyltransferase involved in cell wall biosynthesis
VTTPDVSVLLPIRDAQGTLPEALESLRTQTLPGIEVIAVDDGSTDGTGEVLEEWKGRIPGLQVLSTPPRGIVPALRLALSQARGTYLARMDGDDRCPARRMELQRDRLAGDPRVGIVGSLVRIFPEERRREGLEIYEGWLNSVVTHEEITRDLFVECPIAHPSMMMRREEMVALGGYEDHGWPEDYDLLLRYAEADFRLEKIPEVLLDWREGPGRLFRQDARYGKEAFWRVKAHYLARGPLAGAPSVWIWGAGEGGRRLGRALADEGVTIRAFVDVDPRKIGSTRRGLPILPPEGLAPEEGEIIVAAVAARGARTEVRERLVGLGFVEGKHFICAA